MVRSLKIASILYFAVQECVASFPDHVPARATIIANRDSSASDILPEAGNLDRRESLTLRHTLTSRGPPTCPENVGAQKLPCGSCGGEDPKNKGHCKDKNAAGGYCECDTASGTGTPVLSTVTATQSGKTATGTYALQSISSYASLRQSITTTITSTTTKTDGSNGVETAAAVILAGGVAWFLQSFAGEAAVAESALEAPKEAETHEDDKKCPNPESKCSDCHAVGGMCTTGDGAGCGCQDDDKCPTGDQQPKCSDQNCQGNKENKCTKDHKDCECKKDEKEECPDGEDTPFCNDCGGIDAGKCKGIKDKDDQYKGCGCVDNALIDSHPYEPFDAKQYAIWATAISGLPKITESSYDVDPSDNMPTCQRAGWSAPEKGSDGKPGVTDKINEWCKDMDGKEVKGTDLAKDGVLYKMFEVNYYSYYLSANEWLQAPDDNKCGDNNKISKDECVDTLTEGMQACDFDGQSHGMSLPGKCLQFNITLYGGKDPDFPPWNPRPRSADPQCDMDSLSGVANNWFSGLYPQFCDEVNKDKNKKLSKDMTNKDFKAPSSKRTLWARTPPPSGSSYDGFKFHFDWTGGEGDCRKDCSGAFSSITSSPCGATGGERNGMSKKTSLEVGCGTYTYEITPKEKDPPPPAEKNCEPNSSNNYMSVDSLTKNIGEFCDKLNSLGPVKGGTDHTETYNKDTMDQADLSAHWDGDDKTLYTEVNKDKCKDALTGFINGCNVPSGKKTQYGNPEAGSNSLNWKHGGTYKDLGITYKIAPTAKRHTPAPDEDRGLTTCAVFYKGLWNTFDIWGFGMLSADKGEDVLLPKIKSCGAVTKWEFTYYKDGPGDADWPTLKGVEWHAKGRLPIGPQMWSCVGDAIAAAGHPSAGSCAGQ